MEFTFGGMRGSIFVCVLPNGGLAPFPHHLENFLFLYFLKRNKMKKLIYVVDLKKNF